MFDFTWEHLPDDRKKQVLREWIGQGTPLTGMAKLFRTTEGIIEAFVALHLPELMNLLGACRVSPQEIERRKSAMRGDSYPPFGFKAGGK